MLGQGITSQALYWSIYDQSEADASIDQLISTDNLEKLLEVKTLTFELRSQSDVLIDYFSKPATLKKLLRIVFNVKEPNEITERAIEIFSSSETLRDILPNLVASHELLQMPFEALTRNVQKLTTGATDPLLPGDLCQQFIYNGFSRLIHAILFSPKRVPQLVGFLKANIKYMRAWVAHTVNSCVTTSLKEFLIDTMDTCPEARKDIAELAMSSGVVYALVNFLTSSDKSIIPFECVTSASSLLSQILYKKASYLYDIIIDRIPTIAEYVLSSQLHGPSLLRLPQASEVLVCALSSIVTSLALKYHELSQVIFDAKLPEDLHKRRLAEALSYIEDKQIPKQVNISKAKADSKDGKKSSSGGAASLLVAPKLSPLGIKEIDELEAMFAPTFFRVIQLFNLLPDRLNYMMNMAPANTLGIGCFDLIKMIGRLLAITADIRDQLYFKRTGINPVQEWIAGEANTNASNSLFDFSRYACLSNFAHAGAGGTPETPFADTIQIGSGSSAVPFIITTSTIILKLIDLKIPAFIVALFKRFPEHSNLHFVISRVLLPLIEFVDYKPSISMHIFRETSLLRDMHEASNQYTVFKLRDSRLTYYVTFARAFLRIGVKLSDEAAMEEKRKYVSSSASSGSLTTISCPQTVPALANLLAEGHTDLDVELCTFLVNNDSFKEFSKTHLEPEESIPKTFGDARLSSDYAEATRRTNVAGDGNTVYDTAFSWTSGADNNADFLFSNFGNFAANEKEGDGGFSLTGLSAAVTDVESGDIYAQFSNIWNN